MSLEVRADREGSTLRVALSGELDAYTTPTVSNVVGPSLDGSDLVAIVIDARELSFMDSAGISELLRIQRLLAERGASIRIEGVGPMVRRVLEITGLLGILGVQ